MALVVAAVCPHPPLLVPEVAGGESVVVREPALAATRRLVDCRPDLVVVVGDAPQTRAYGGADSGSFDAYGVQLRVTLGPRTCFGQPILPLSLTVGAWLLRQADATIDRQGLGISATATPEEAAAAGREIAALDSRVALLAMGDGSARRTERAPGFFDPRAQPFDTTVGDALAAADPDRLLALAPDLARELLAAGRASWQVLAGAAAGGRWAGRLCYDDAPYGVGYLVAIWESVA